MAEVKGKLVTCDRPGCGRQVFLKTTGEGERDGGYTRWNEFEPYPEGWETHREAGGVLCPDCAREYNALLEKFKHAKEDQTDATD
jgi:hypothetical protein